MHKLTRELRQHERAVLERALKGIRKQTDKVRWVRDARIGTEAHGAGFYDPREVAALCIAVQQLADGITKIERCLSVHPRGLKK